MHPTLSACVRMGSILSTTVGQLLSIISSRLIQPDWRTLKASPVAKICFTSLRRCAASLRVTRRWLHNITRARPSTSCRASRLPDSWVYCQKQV